MSSTSRRARTAPIGLLVVAALLFLFTPLRVVRVIALLILLVYAVAFLFVRLAPRGLKVSRAEELSHAMKLQTFDVTLTLRNRGVLPVPLVTVTDLPGSLYTASASAIVSVGAGEERGIAYRAQGRERGAYELGPVTISGRDPFGLLSWSRRIELPGRVVVYPTIHRLDFVVRRGVPSGTLAVADRMYEDVTRFRSLREYVPGDDVKRINWKASAKNNKLFTTEFDATLSAPVLTVLNFSRDDFPRRQRESLLERAAELAASVPFHFSALDQQVGFVTSGRAPGGEGPLIRATGAGYEHAQGILELIATLEPSDGHADFAALLYRSGVTAGTGMKIIVVSPPPRREQADVLVAARRKGTNLMLVQVESQVERTEDAHVAGALPIVPVRSIGGEPIRG